MILSVTEFLTLFFGVCSDATVTNSSMLYVIIPVWNTLRSFKAWKNSLFANWKKTNRKSKTNTRKSVRGQFWKYFLQPSYFCHLFRWSPSWDEESLCNDKGKGIVIILLEWPIYVIEKKHRKIEKTECDGKRINLAT